MSRVSSTARRTAKSLASLAGASILVASGLAMSAAPASAATPSLTVSFAGSQSPMPEAADWDAVTYGDGEFVAVGEGNGYTASTDAAYSVDGTTWTPATLPATSTWYSVTYGDNEFVAISSNGEVADSTNGSTWTLATDTLPTGGDWHSVTYGNGEFVAVDAATTEAAYSIDGSTWVAATLPASSNWQTVAYGDGEFVTVGASSTDAAYSTNGSTWTAATLPATEAWGAIAYGNGEFIAISTITNDYAYSADGITWTIGALPTAENWEAIAYGNGQFEIVNAVGETATSSDDGSTWTLAYFEGGFTSVTYGNNEFLILQPILSSVIGSAIPAPAADNEYDATMDVPTDVAPTGNVTFSDSAGWSVEGHSWTAAGSDGDGGYLVVSAFIDEAAQGVGDTISATYEGSDYTPGASNALTIDGPPSITSASITGTAEVGDTLTAASSGVTGYPAPAETYQWFDGSTAIVGATSETYTVQSSDLGDSINVVITETNDDGSPASATSAGTADVTGSPATIASASITGTAEVGDTLTAVSSGVTGYPAPTETYQWYDGLTAITGATSSTYAVQSSDLGDSINVVITETNGIGSPASATSTGTADVTTAPSGGSGDSTPPSTTTTTTTPPVITTTPTTPPSTTTTSSTPKVSTVNLGFPANSYTLPSHERSTLAIVAKTSAKGSHIVVTSYVKGDAKLARLRADHVAEYLMARTKATVTIRVITTSGNKVTVVATKK